MSPSSIDHDYWGHPSITAENSTLLPVQTLNSTSPPVQTSDSTSPPVQTSDSTSPPVQTSNSVSPPVQTSSSISPPVQTSNSTSLPVQPLAKNAVSQAENTIDKRICVLCNKHGDGQDHVSLDLCVLVC